MKIFLACLFLIYTVGGVAYELPEKKRYPLTHDPIDVVIVTHPKDKETLEDCISGIRENCSNVRRIIVVSEIKLTDQAEWFNENQFPFSKEEISLAIAKGNKKKSKKFTQRPGRGPGWFFQQLAKLYSAFVIPDISSNVLVVDSDTIFLNPVSFLDESYGGLFCFCARKIKKSYLAHAKNFLPGYERINPEIYCVCHHMLFQRPILEDLFQTVENYHGLPFWKAFCDCVNFKKHGGASEFEIYYNFALSHTDQVQIRGLKWTQSAHPDEKDRYKNGGYHFVSFHSYMRGVFPRRFNP